MKVLVVADKNDPEGLKQKKSAFWKIELTETKYNSVAFVKDVLDSIEGIDFVLFTRETEPKEHLGYVVKTSGVGYTSIDGFGNREDLYKNFLNCSGIVGFKPRKQLKSEKSAKTFSLVFDTERLSGVGKALPAILKLLERNDTVATFFVTNIMFKAYKNLRNVLETAGHEIGLHGLCHEDVRQMNQTPTIKRMKEGRNVSGANLMGRMNVKTIEALEENKLDYFLYPLKNSKSWISVNSEPVFMKKTKGIWMVPVTVETYGKIWKDVKKQIDNTISRSNHLTVLLHPFNDGTEEGLEKIEKIIKYLISLGYRASTVKDVIAPRPKSNIELGIRLFNKTSGLNQIIERRKIKSVLNRYHKEIKNGLRPVLVPYA